MAHSTRKRRKRKASNIDRPPKPDPKFPLSAATCGSWQKKIKGRIYYFGKWGRVVNGKLTRIRPDGCWQEALEKYEREREALYAGRTPRELSNEIKVSDLCNAFLTSKLRKVEAGELTAGTFNDYRSTTDRLISTFGKDRPVDDLDPSDFASLRVDLAKQYGPVRLGNEVNKVKTVFKYGRENIKVKTVLEDGSESTRPMSEVQVGSEFVKPSKSVVRKHKAGNGKKLFQAAEIRQLLDAASLQVKAMILLGINCGFGNADCGTLPRSVLKGGWIEYARPKTGIPRRCPLWPETIEALKAAQAIRPNPKGQADAGLVFLTKYGHRWVRAEGKRIDSVGLEFGKLLAQFDLKRPGTGFYALRHTFRTVADATLDHPAIRLIMGHSDGSIDENYRQTIDDARLVAVAEHVRKWLFGNTA